MVADKRTHRRVQVIPLDVHDPGDIQARVRAYLGVLGMPEGRIETLVETACAGAAHGGDAFRRLRAALVDHLAATEPGVADDPECAGLARLALWLDAPAAALESLPVSPPLIRQPMASERDLS